MGGKKYVLLTTLIFALNSCRHNEYDAEFYAKEYCKCLVAERATGVDFFDARTKCDANLIIENRYFRKDYIDLTYGRYLIFLPQSLDDSISVFSGIFFSYVNKNCCKMALMNCDKTDSFQIIRKGKDTAILNQIKY